MRSASSPFLLRSASLVSIASLLLVGFPILIITGCGSGTSSPKPPQFSGNTSVTLVLASTANDQLIQFNLQIQSLTLTNQSGTTVSVISSPLPTEFMHLNGNIEPLATVSVPQGIYNSATAIIGGAEFTCITDTPPDPPSLGSIDISTFAYGYTPNANVTVNVASPITITGETMALSLDLQVAQSATYSTCYDPNSNYTFSITPTFNLSPLTVSSAPTSPANGKVIQLEGQITAIDATNNSLTLSLPDPASCCTRTLGVGTGLSTVYQGINNFSSLGVGTFVDMDGALQPDGTLLATRIAVEDPSAVDLMIGPNLQTGPYQPNLAQPAGLFFNLISDGKDPLPNTWYYGIYGALFQISPQLNNLQSLPFTPAFALSNLVAGQRTYVTSQNTVYSDGVYTAATTVTLMPQTIDGTILQSTAVGNFTDYTVSLASYNLFPTLAQQPNQLSILTNPDTVEVYVDGNTQLLNTTGLAPGNTLRFYGLVFNDNGTLRMDCAQVNDGVSFAVQPTASPARVAGHAQIIQRTIMGSRQLVVRRITSQ